MWSSTVEQMTPEVKFENISLKWMRLMMNDLHHYHVGSMVLYFWNNCLDRGDSHSPLSLQILYLVSILHHPNLKLAAS